MHDIEKAKLFPSENVTFWAGPAKSTGLAADVFPGENGFFLKPETIDIRVFMNHQPEVQLEQHRE